MIWIQIYIQIQCNGSLGKTITVLAFFIAHNIIKFFKSSYIFWLAQDKAFDDVKIMYIWPLKVYLQKNFLTGAGAHFGPNMFLQWLFKAYKIWGLRGVGMKEKIDEQSIIQGEFSLKNLGYFITFSQKFSILHFLLGN